MGNRSATKTFPSSSWPVWTKNTRVEVASSNEAVSSRDLVLDAKAAPLDAPNSADQSAYAPRGRARTPREAPDLYVYISYRNWELARKQIEINRGLDYVSTNRRFSVLHVAMENNAPVDIVQRLLDKGLDVNISDMLFNQTPLHILMKVLNEQNSINILTCLLAAGADVNARAKYGRTPLYCALKYRVGERFVTALLRAGARIHTEELIFAKEKCGKNVAQALERVAIMTVICTSHFQAGSLVYKECGESRCSGYMSKRHCLIASTPIAMLPVELFRELKRYLF